MRMAHVWVLVTLIAWSGCGESSAREAAPSAGQATPVAPGVVQIPPASLRYIEVESAGDSAGKGLVRAPARVSFVEGAMAEVGVPMPGRVTRVHVKVGDAVSAGDPLVTMTSPEAAAARAALEGALAAHQVAKDEARREHDMLEQGIGIERDKLAAEARLREAAAEVARARTAVSYLGQGAGPAVVVRAPIAGTVIARDVTVGAYVEPGGAALVQLGDPASLRITADVFERDVHLVRVGAEVDVELASVNARASGRVVAVGSVLATGVRTAPVYIDLVASEDQSLSLRPGMYARVAIGADAQSGVTVPAGAVLIKDGSRHVVYVRAGEDRFALRDVMVGHSSGGQVQILAGIQPGDDIVVKGALLLDGVADQLL